MRARLPRKMKQLTLSRFGWSARPALNPSPAATGRGHGQLTAWRLCPMPCVIALSSNRRANGHSAGRRPRLPASSVPGLCGGMTLRCLSRMSPCDARANAAGSPVTWNRSPICAIDICRNDHTIVITSASRPSGGKCQVSSNQTVKPFQSLIGSSILMLHGQRVMLDSDLAKLHDVQTKVLMQTVARKRRRGCPTVAERRSAAW